jgi:glycosyltransferase involved in cell wall biosynthesis
MLRGANMKHIAISIVIPMYNSEETIIDSINSVLNQTYKNYEIVIVDDGSTDNSYIKVEEFIQKNNIADVVLIKQNNNGPSAARNRGIEITRGKYIAFLDSDDTWHKDKLLKQINILEKYNVDLLGCTINENVYKNKGYIIDISFDMLLLKNYFSTPTVILKKEILKDIGVFDAKKRYSEDYNLWLRIANKYKCAIINESLVLCGNGKPTFGYSGLSKNLWAMEVEEIKNYIYLFKNRYINLFKFNLITIFSFIKYIRRLIITRH